MASQSLADKAMAAFLAGTVPPGAASQADLAYQGAAGGGGAVANVELAYAEILANFASVATNKNAATDVPGLSISPVVGSRPIVVRFVGRAMFSDQVAGSNMSSQIVETDTKTNLGTTNLSNVLTGSGFSAVGSPWVPNAALVIPNVPAGTTITSVTDDTHIVMSANATLTAAAQTGTVNHRIADNVRTSSGAGSFVDPSCSRRLSPTAGTHVYKVQLYGDAGTTTIAAIGEGTTPGASPASIEAVQV